MELPLAPGFVESLLEFFIFILQAKLGNPVVGNSLLQNSSYTSANRPIEPAPSKPGTTKVSKQFQRLIKEAFSNTVEEGQRAVCTSDGNEKEGVWCKTSFQVNVPSDLLI